MVPQWVQGVQGMQWVQWAVEGGSREEAEGLKLPRDTETGTGKQGEKEADQGVPGQPGRQLQMETWPEGQSWHPWRGGEVPSQVPLGAGGWPGRASPGQGPPLLPLRVLGLSLLLQPLPPVGSGPGRSCWFSGAQDSRLPGFSL